MECKSVQFLQVSLGFSQPMQMLNNIFQFLARHQQSLWKWTYVIAIAFFAAKATNMMIAHYYLPIDYSALPARTPMTSSSSSAPSADISKIQSRNIFDSEARKRIADTTQSSMAGVISPSTLPIELTGTVVFRNPRFSVALIKDRSSNKHAYYGVGDVIQGAIVQKVERFRVILENQGRLESIELKAAESKLTPKLMTPPSPSPGSMSDVQLEEIGPNRFAVPSSVIDDVMTNFGAVLTQARMVPNLTPDNKTDGFKIFQIRPGSIFEKLGLKDQDIIMRVNSQDLDSFEKATGLFTALRNEKTISIDIVRGGSRLNYTYEIR